MVRTIRNTLAACALAVAGLTITAPAAHAYHSCTWGYRVVAVQTAYTVYNSHGLPYTAYKTVTVTQWYKVWR
jgi:hypothetical protein